jgi:hypothetical protein
VFAHYVKDMKKQINEAKRFQKLAGLLNENEQSSTEEQVFDVLASNMNPELNTFIQPVEFMLDQAFGENVDISTILEEVKREMEFQLERSNNNKDLRLIFAKVEAILSNGNIEEGIAKTIGAGLLGLGLSLGSPKTAAAQSPQQIEKSVSDSTTNISSMDDKKAGETLLISFQKNPFTADMWSKLSGDNAKLFRIMKTMLDRLQVKPEDIQPEDIAALGRKYKKTTSAAEFLDRAKALEAAKKKGIEETVNEALRKFRKGK